MEESKALPSYRYGDPANVVEFDEMDAMGCRLCTKHEVNLTRSICTEVRNASQKGVPNIGHRCKWFVERVEK